MLVVMVYHGIKLNIRIFFIYYSKHNKKVVIASDSEVI